MAPTKFFHAAKAWILCRSHWLMPSGSLTGAVGVLALPAVLLGVGRMPVSVRALSVGREYR